MLPTGAVTLLLADVEGSTELWQRDASGAHSAMSELDALADELVAKFGGVRPVEQGEGDSFVAAFARPSDGVACALELQLCLADGPVRVRIGVHTGEIEVRDQRYDGPTVIRAARVRDLGHGGQTVVTEATRGLVLDTLPDGTTFVDLGSHSLKGLERAERVYQLTHPSLTSTFPPLRTSKPTKGSLPVRLTTFVGRSAEIEEVRRLVRTERLVSLTGAGGCGKTRLAIEAMRDVAEDRDGDVWFCDLAPLSDPELVAQALRMVIGFPESATGDDLDVLCSQLSDSDAVVILDNCEHLIASCADLADALLRRCERLRILATSREPLGVEGEVAWRVPSLSTPDADASVDAASRYDAIGLFVDRAIQGRPRFVLDATNVAAVTEICNRLDGIPLAIELAAARVRVLSVRQIADGLGDRFRLLGRGARTTLDRQRTLLASVGWSHDLLTEAQRVVLRRLSVFVGGFTLEAAEDVVAFGDVQGTEVLELVTQLVDRSLVTMDESSVRPRYGMLETIRQFARDRLIDDGDAIDVADRHLRFFAGWAEEMFDETAGSMDLTDAIGRVIDDYDNVRSACEWALDNRRDLEGLRLASALERFWNNNTSSREAATWLETLLARTTDAPPAIRLRGLLALGAAMEHFNDFEPAIAAAAEALPLARDVDDRPLLMRVLLHLGTNTAFVDRPTGMPYLEEAIAIARETGDVVALCEGLFAIGQVRGFDAVSLAASSEALELAAPLGAAYSARPRLNVGVCYALRGELAEAESQLVQARAELKELGDEWLAFGAQVGLGIVEDQRGHRDEARRHVVAAFEWCRSMDRADGMAWFGPYAAALEIGDGRLDRAMPYIDAVWPFFGTMPGPFGASARALAHALTAVVKIASNEPDAARSERDLALSELNDDEPYASASSPTFDLCARVTRALGEIADAEAIVARGLRCNMDLGAFLYIPDLLDVAGALRNDVGAHDDAARLFAAADGARARMGMVSPPSPVLDVDAEIARARVALGEDGYAEIWSAGRDLGLDDAVAYALRGRGPRQRPQAGWDSLTPTELKVVELVAQGLSNPQAAERLFISPRTVSTHVSHVFAKLGVTSRAELAALAAKRGAGD